jgi:hypothetical protein
MSKEFNIKYQINEKYGLDISNRALTIFIEEFKNEDESFIDAKRRILEDIDLFYHFVSNRTDLPITLGNNLKTLDNYLDELNFLGKSIVTLKNYCAGNEIIKKAIPELEKIHSNYETKIKEMIEELGLNPNYRSSKMRKKRNL